MASSNPLAAIPSGVSHPLHLAAGLGEPSGEGSKKRKRTSSQVLALRYNFKPASITPDTPGALYADNGTKTLKFDLATGGQQVFDAREEGGKTRECVMIWDEESQTFTLHPLSSTLHLTLNRSASSTTSNPSQPTFTPTRTSNAPRKDSVTSSASSTAVPLAESAEGSRKRARPSVVMLSEAPPSSGNRPVRAGKSIPRKQPPAPAQPIKEGRGKGGAKKKVAPPVKGRQRTEIVPTKTPEKKKVISAEIIDDSDEEAAAHDDGPEGKVEEEDDEFAMLLGASLAGGADVDEDEDDDEDDEEDDVEALGGAKVVVHGDGSEWL